MKMKYIKNIIIPVCLSIMLCSCVSPEPIEEPTQTISIPESTPEPTINNTPEIIVTEEPYFSNLSETPMVYPIYESKSDNYYLINEKREKITEPIFYYYSTHYNEKDEAQYIILTQIVGYEGGSDDYEPDAIQFNTLMDMSGKVISKLKYTGIRALTDNYVEVSIDGNRGILNISTGKEVIPLEYDYFEVFGNYFIAQKDNTHTVFDSSLQKIFSSEYKYFDVNEDYIIASENGEYGYGLWDSNFKNILPFDYSKIVLMDENIIFAEKERDCMLFSPSGTLIKMFENTSLQKLYRYSSRNWIPLRTEKGIGIVDFKGNWLVDPKYDHEIADYHNGIITFQVVGEYYLANYNKTYNYINRRGNYYFLENYREDSAIANSKGEIIFSDIVDCNIGDNYISFTDKTGFSYVYDLDLNLILKYKCDSLQVISDNLFYVKIISEDYYEVHKSIIINKYGKEIYSTETWYIDGITNMDNKFLASYPYMDIDLTTVFTLEGKEIFKNSYRCEFTLDKKYIMVSADNYNGLMDFDGKWVYKQRMFSVLDD